MKTLVFALSLLLAACQAAPVPETPNEVAQNWRMVTDSVVALVAADLDPYCSGVWYKDKIITADHCIEHLEDGEPAFYSPRSAYTYEGNKFTEAFVATVEKRVQDMDLALLVPTQEPPPHRNMLLSRKLPYMGQHVFAVGHSYGVGYTISEGRVVAPLRTGDTLPWIKEWTHTSALLEPGMSGGPLFTEDAEILGINSGGSRTTIQGHAYLVHIRTLVEE